MVIFKVIVDPKSGLYAVYSSYRTFCKSNSKRESFHQTKPKNKNQRKLFYKAYGEPGAYKLGLRFVSKAFWAKKNFEIVWPCVFYLTVET